MAKLPDIEGSLQKEAHMSERQKMHPPPPQAEGGSGMGPQQHGRAAAHEVLPGGAGMQLGW